MRDYFPILVVGRSLHEKILENFDSACYLLEQVVFAGKKLIFCLIRVCVVGFAIQFSKSS